MEQITVDMMPEHLENELNNELLPGCSLTGDISSLAGELDFRMDEIDYICSKQAPFKFLIDQWCKRDRKKATFQKLTSALLELRRPDLVEKINETVLYLNKASFEKLEELVNVQDHRCRRRDEDASFNPTDYEKVDEKTPLVYFVYMSEDESTEYLIENFANSLRQEYAINVLTNQSSKDYPENKQVFVLNNLIKADYILIFCNKDLSISQKNRISKVPQPTELHKELMFCLHYIVKEVFRNKGVNKKYIPIITEETQIQYIPKVLLGPKRYMVPLQTEDLVRRFLSVEDFALPDVGKGKKFSPRIVSTH